MTAGLHMRRAERLSTLATLTVIGALDLSFAAICATLAVLLYYFVKESHVIFILILFNSSGLGLLFFVFFLFLLLGCLGCRYSLFLGLISCRGWSIYDIGLAFRLFRLVSDCMRRFLDAAV